MTALADALTARDAMPSPVPPEVAALRPALAQRARLLALLASDADALRECVRRGTLPASVLERLANGPAGLASRYRADLAVCPDGVWRVTRDRVSVAGRHMLEVPILAIFLPAMCRSLLGEGLLLPSMPALWLAEASGRHALAAQPRRWSVRAAFDPDSVPVSPVTLPADRRAELQARVAACPDDHVACLGADAIATSMSLWCEFSVSDAP